MSRYRFDLATPDDDASLRTLMADTPTEGDIAITFHREPSWFAGAVVDGKCRQVVACRDVGTGRIVGFGCRSLRDVYVNGRPAVVGYLSSLRLLPELYEVYNPMPYDGARDMEVELAIALREAGYGVWQA